MSAERALAVRVQLAATRQRGLAIDAAFDVPPGITILFGPSGAGKSTILSAIAGLLRPDAGRVSLGDEVWFDAASGKSLPPHLRKASVVFQSLSLFPHLSALDNVEYGIDRAVPRDQRRARALAMLARIKVLHVAARKPRTLSGGEAQRVALARAFARDPKVVLLDEAFSAMDRALRRSLHAEVSALVGELSVPCIQVTHDPEEAQTMGSRCVKLEAGRVLAVGPVAELLLVR